MRHLPRVSPISAKHPAVPGDVEMNRPLVPLQVIPGPLPRLHVVSRQPEVLASRRLQIVPDRLSVRAPELVPEDLHRHRPRVYLRQPGPIRPYRPDPVHFVPWPFVAKHHQPRIGGREQQMVQPVVRAVNHLHLARVHIQREHCHRQPRRPPLLHHLPLVLRLIECVHLRPAAALPPAIVLARRPFDVSSSQQRLIRVHRRHRSPRRQCADPPRLARIDIRPPRRAVFDVVNPPALPPRLDHPHASRHHLPGGPRRQIHHRHPVRRRVNHPPAVRRVPVLVEVEARAARLLRQPDHAMPGVRIHPFRRRLLCAQHRGHHQRRAQPGPPVRYPPRNHSRHSRAPGSIVTTSNRPVSPSRSSRPPFSPHRRLVPDSLASFCLNSWYPVTAACKLP